RRRTCRRCRENGATAPPRPDRLPATRPRDPRGHGAAARGGSGPAARAGRGRSRTTPRGLAHLRRAAAPPGPLRTTSLLPHFVEPRPANHVTTKVRDFTDDSGYRDVRSFQNTLVPNGSTGQARRSQPKVEIARTLASSTGANGDGPGTAPQNCPFSWR